MRAKAKPIRILVAHHGPEFQQALPPVLCGGRVDCVGVVNRLDDLIEAYRDVRPDAVVMDIRFERGMGDRSSSMLLREAHPRAPVVLCSEYDPPELLMKRIESVALP